MASDHWYIVKGRGRAGPFSQKELDSLFKAGQLSYSTLLWREGMVAPIRVRDLVADEVSESKHHIRRQKVQRGKIQNGKIRSEKEGKAFPKVQAQIQKISPIDFIQNLLIQPSLRITKRMAERLAETGSKKQPFEVKEIQRKTSSKKISSKKPAQNIRSRGDQKPIVPIWAIRSMIALLITGGGYTVWSALQEYFPTPTDFQDKPVGVNRSSFEKVKNRLETSTESGKVAWSIITSKDLGKMWLAHNLPGTAWVKVSLFSKGQHNSLEKPISAFQSIKVTDGNTELGPWSFTKNDRIAPGKYKMIVQVQKFTPKTGFGSQSLTVKSKYKKHVYIGIQSLAELNHTVANHKAPHKDPRSVKKGSKPTKSRILNKKEPTNSASVTQARDNRKQLSFSAPKNVRRKNQNLIKKPALPRLSSKQMSLTDLSMKYQTLKMISERLKQELKGLESISNLNKQNQALKTFRSRYVDQYGRFFTSFVIENEGQFKSLTTEAEKLDSNLVTHYAWLTQNAKNLGAISMNALEAPSAKSIEWTRLISKFELISKSCEKRIEKLRQ